MGSSKPGGQFSRFVVSVWGDESKRVAVAITAGSTAGRRRHRVSKRDGTPRRGTASCHGCRRIGRGLGHCEGERQTEHVDLCRVAAKWDGRIRRSSRTSRRPCRCLGLSRFIGSGPGPPAVVGADADVERFPAEM